MDSNFAYFSLLGEEKEHRAVIEKAARHGWRLDTRINYSCLYYKVRGLDLPENFEMRVGESGSKSMMNDSTLIREKVFKMNSKTSYEVLKSLKQLKGLSVTIYSSTGKLAASGSVFSKGEYAYLFAGGVMPRYRKKGLWKCLLAARQAITVGQGVRYWLYTSGNPFIHQKGDVVFKNLTLKKDPE